MATTKKAVFTFGRMNPPTIGHEKIISHVLSVAKMYNAEPFIFLSQKQDSNKNPLTHKQKIAYLKMSVPDAAPHVVENAIIKNIFDALKYLNASGYTELILVVGSDRVFELKTKLLPYVQSKKLFSFTSFSIVNGGDRDPDVTGIFGISSTKMRTFASKNDFLNFKKYTPSKLPLTQTLNLFTDVKKALGLNKKNTQTKVKNSLNVPRNKMPQIRRDFIPDFINFLKDNDIKVFQKNMSVVKLKPTQNEINMDKVWEKYKSFLDGKIVKPFIVSYDNFILDGHHQLFALKYLNKNKDILCYVVNMPMKKLLDFAKRYPNTSYKTIFE